MVGEDLGEAATWRPLAAWRGTAEPVGLAEASSEKKMANKSPQKHRMIPARRLLLQLKYGMMCCNIKAPPDVTENEPTHHK